MSSTAEIPGRGDAAHVSIAPAASPVTVREVIGEIFITLGILLLLFAFYEAFWTDIRSGELQGEAQQQLDDEWRNPRATHLPGMGEAFAQLHIPAFGSDYHYAVLEGTDDDTLLAGPGHYPDTQMPDEPGNFALAGHRVGKGSPFNDLGHLNACDAIVVETQDQWFTYRVLPMEEGEEGRTAASTSCLDDSLVKEVASGRYAHVPGRHITVPSDTTVLAPLPGAPGVPADKLGRVITLTTCHPQFSNAERMIIHAVQTEARDKSAGPPPALTGGKGN
mgnify:FL=1